MKNEMVELDLEMIDLLDICEEYIKKTGSRWEGADITVFCRVVWWAGSETDCVMSYFPLADWIGKNTGTFNFHGFYKNNDFVNHNVSCNTYDWDFYPVNIEKIKKNISNFEEKM